MTEEKEKCEEEFRILQHYTGIMVHYLPDDDHFVNKYREFVEHLDPLCERDSQIYIKIIKEIENARNTCKKNLKKLAQERYPCDKCSYYNDHGICELKEGLEAKLIEYEDEIKERMA